MAEGCFTCSSCGLSFPNPLARRQHQAACPKQAAVNHWPIKEPAGRTRQPLPYSDTPDEPERLPAGPAVKTTAAIQPGAVAPADLNGNDNCAHCCKPDAKKRCSQCKSVFCSAECQHTACIDHKPSCIPAVTSVSASRSTATTVQFPSGSLVGQPLPIYYINLDRCATRRSRMHCMFDSLGWKDVHRVSAVDGSNMAAFEARCSLPGHRHTNDVLELACTASHVLAIKTALKDGQQMALILEDDMDVTPLAQLHHEFTTMLHSLAPDWDILQVHTSNAEAIKMLVDVPPGKVANWNHSLWSTGAYVVRRSGMHKICKAFSQREQRVCFPVLPFLQADHVLYNICKTLTTKPFLIHNDVESMIHPDHSERFHREGREALLDYFERKQLVIK